MGFSKRTRRGTALAAVAALTAVGLVGTAVAALQGNENAKKPKVLIGADNDDTSNTTIQPPGVTANQSLRKSDQIFGGKASDTIIGRLGSDVLLANAGDDVMVGGTEGGQPALPPGQLPDNNDIAYGGVGSDSFIWAPGDGSDAFIGGNPAKVKKVKGKASAAKGKGKKKAKPEVDTLVVGNLVLSSDLTLPQLFGTKFGQLPLVFASDRGVPTPLGGTPPRNPNLTGNCQILVAPAGLGYDYLVRFFGNTPQSPATQAVTIRIKGVEQVICPTEGTDGATLTTLGKSGTGPVQTKSTNFTPQKGSQLAAFVR
jgi:RTX calcium-binding nonapeptide repeat (4 copies)